MAAAPWQLTNTARQNILNAGYGNLAAATPGYKCALVTSASNVGAASTTWAAVTGELAAANGYATGGITVSPLVISAATLPTVKFGTNPTWTATPGNLVANKAVVYEIGGNVLCWCQLDPTGGTADVTILAGNPLTVDAITNPLISTT